MRLSLVALALALLAAPASAQPTPNCPKYVTTCSWCRDGKTVVCNQRAGIDMPGPNYIPLPLVASDPLPSIFDRSVESPTEPSSSAQSKGAEKAGRRSGN